MRFMRLIRASTRSGLSASSGRAGQCRQRRSEEWKARWCCVTSCSYSSTTGECTSGAGLIENAEAWRVVETADSNDMHNRSRNALHAPSPSLKRSKSSGVRSWESRRGHHFIFIDSRIAFSFSPTSTGSP